MAWPEKEKNVYFCVIFNQLITPLTTWWSEAIKIYSGNTIESQQKSISNGKPILQFLSKTTKIIDQSVG